MPILSFKHVAAFNNFDSTPTNKSREVCSLGWTLISSEEVSPLASDSFMSSSIPSGDWGTIAKMICCCCLLSVSHQRNSLSMIAAHRTLLLQTLLAYYVGSMLPDAQATEAAAAAFEVCELRHIAIRANMNCHFCFSLPLRRIKSFIATVLWLPFLLTLLMLSLHIVLRHATMPDRMDAIWVKPILSKVIWFVRISHNLIDSVKLLRI